MNTQDHRNGCHNRPPFAAEYRLTGGAMQANFSHDKPCEYTKSDLGQADKGCTDCTWRKKELTAEQALQLADIESIGPGPFFMNQATADACLAEYGQLPSNFVLMTLLPSPGPVPVVAPMLVQPRGAQWKRERAGRGPA